MTMTSAPAAMITFHDLAEAVRAGKTFDVELTEMVESQESYADRGMRGRLVNVREEDEDVLSFGLDLAPYDAHNDSVAKTNYYDKDGKAVLNGKQAGYYPKDGIERIWTSADDNLSTMFVLLDERQARLYSEFLAEPPESRGTYVSWLERKLIAADA